MLKALRYIKDRFLVSYRKYGHYHIIKILLSNFFKPIFQYLNYKVFVKELQENIDCNSNGLKLRIFRNISELRQNIKGEIAEMNPCDLAQERLKKGQFCAVTEDKEGNQLFYLWFSYGRRKIETNFTIKNDEAFFYSAYTILERRGQNIYPVALELLASYLSKERIKKLYCFISPTNFSSIRGVEKAGFKKVRNLRNVKFLMCNKLIFKL